MVSRASLSAGTHFQRCRVLQAEPADDQARANAAEIQHADRIRLPVRLRLMPGSRAAFLSDAGGDHRSMQSHLPRVLQRKRVRTARRIAPWSRSNLCSTAWVRNEGEPDVVQISGGEPTIHPQFFEVLDAAKRRPIKHLMINTNGIKIANDPEFAERLAQYMPGFEVYLQFDSPPPGTADRTAWRRSDRHPQAGVGSAQRAQHFNDTGRHAEERVERSGSRADYRLCIAAAVRARRDISTDSVGRPARGIRSSDPIA